MKKPKTKVKHLSTEDFLTLFKKLISDSCKGHRLQKNGKRIKMQSIDKYIYVHKLLYDFHTETGFEFKLFLVNRLTDMELKKAKLYYRQFYINFTQYLYKRGNFDNYVGLVIKTLRTFFNYLLVEQQLQIGMFHKTFHVPHEEIPIVVLSPRQVNYLIHNTQLQEKLPANLHVIKDIFVMGCTVGLRVSDLMNLKTYNLVRQDNGYYLKVRSQKTNTETSIKLPSYALAILKKYNTQKNNLLPSMSTWHFNQQIKKMATYISDDEPMIKVRLKNGKPTIIYKNEKKKIHYTMADHVTSHTMRRTAITTMLRLGVPEQVVRKISGHAANSKEFYKYVAFSQSYQDVETDKMFEKLTTLSAYLPAG
jgi:site-specific recombinase XerD